MSRSNLRKVKLYLKHETLSAFYICSYLEIFIYSTASPLGYKYPLIKFQLRFLVNIGYCLYKAEFSSKSLYAMTNNITLIFIS